MKFDVFEYTSKGGRGYNEDSLGSHSDSSGGVFVVCDGLGGHALGEVASAAAVERIITDWDTSAENIKELLTERIDKANQTILELQEEKSAVMKTTVAAVAINESKAVWANSGDSRVYFIHDCELHAYTNDHSVAYKKYKSGEITRDMIATDEDQSCLLRCLGNKDRYQPEITESDVPIEKGDAFLLCSDGAWEYIRDEEIVIDFLKSETAEKWAELLLLRAMERIEGGNDNISVLTVIVK